MEAESATLANLLPDCTAAIINGGNAFTAGLNPVTDTIFVEDVNPETNAAVPDLVNVIVARTEDKDNEVYKKIVEAYQTPEVQKPLKDEYQSAFVCCMGRCRIIPKNTRAGRNARPVFFEGQEKDEKYDSKTLCIG